MKKFIYRNKIEYIGEIIDESKTHYIIKTAEDTHSLEKNLTVIEEVKNENITIEIINYIEGEHIKTGKLIETKTKAYLIQNNGSNYYTVYKLSKTPKGYKADRYFNVQKGTLKGGAGLPKLVINEL